MQLWRLILGQYRWVFLGLIIMSIASALASIAVIAYINDVLTKTSNQPTQVLLKFIGLLVILLILRFTAQFSLTYIGHQFVYDFRNGFVKRIMDTDIAQIEKIGSAKLLASLSNDIEKIQIAFIRLPEFFQGSILCVVAIGYLAYLAWDIFLVVLVIIIAIGLIAYAMVKQVYKYYYIVRATEDEIYADYEAIIHGRKELALNRLRANHLYSHQLQKNAESIRKKIILGDTFHLTALNWANVMLLGGIGVVFFLSNVLGWASTSVATTFALTMLFLQSPLIQTIGSIPTFLNAEVSFKQIEKLALVETPTAEQADFNIATKQPTWQTLSMKNIHYAYTDESENETFSIGAIDLTLNKGEVVFVIGGNGSGKSTFAKILTGLYTPKSGSIMLDNKVIKKEDYVAYRQLFSAIYTDLHLFKKVIGKENYQLTNSEEQSMQEWLQLLQMDKKLQFDDENCVQNAELSQGQRKRLAMLLAVLEQRDLWLLDEWAADQDPQYRRIFYHELLPKLKSMGKTMVVISHDDHYFEQADRLLQMKGGKLIELIGDARRKASLDAVDTIS